MSPEILINLAYVALLGSTATRTATWLRVLLTVAAVLFVGYGLAEDITSMVIWNLVIGSFHASHVVRDQAARRRVHLTRDERAIRDEWFAALDDLDFHTLWSLGTSVELHDTAMVSAGEQPEDVALILEGTAVVEQGDYELATLGRGQLIGEMSFASGEAARASVRIGGRARLHRWGQRDLTTLDRLNPAASKAFGRLIQSDLAAKSG